MKTKGNKDKINIITLGCSKNMVDSEVLMGQLMGNNIAVSHESEVLDFNTVIINTCGFIDNAKQESIDTILKYTELKEQGKIDKVYVTGCLSQRYKPELEKEIPTSDWAQVSLFKFHLNNNDGTNASKSLFKILDNDRMDLKIKHRVFNEFLIFAYKNPAYLKDIDKAIPYFDIDREINVA